MNNIYDNGEVLLGEVKKLRCYVDSLFKTKKISEEDWLNFTKELIWYKDNEVIAINYDHGMGLSIESWDETCIVKECE